MTEAIQSIGIIGAGQMGNGVARVCAVAGFDVVVQDIDPDTLANPDDITDAFVDLASPDCMHNGETVAAGTNSV